VANASSRVNSCRGVTCAVLSARALVMVGPSEGSRHFKRRPRLPSRMYLCSVSSICVTMGVTFTRSIGRARASRPCASLYQGRTFQSAIRSHWCRVQRLNESKPSVFAQHVSYIGNIECSKSFARRREFADGARTIKRDGLIFCAGFHNWPL
jgi:hypothetical protein